MRLNDEGAGGKGRREGGKETREGDEGEGGGVNQCRRL